MTEKEQSAIVSSVKMPAPLWDMGALRKAIESPPPDKYDALMERYIHAMHAFHRHNIPGRG